jgi:pentatricopeptide repeat protein
MQVDPAPLTLQQTEDAYVASPETIDLDVAQSNAELQDGAAETKEIIWPREDRYRFEETSVSEPRTLAPRSQAKGKQPIRGDQDLPEEKLEQGNDDRAQRRQKDLEEIRKELSAYRRRVKNPNYQRSGRQGQVQLLEQILKTIRRPNASQFIHKSIRLGHYRRLLSRLGLGILNDLPNASSSRISIPFDKLLEHAWRVELTAFHAGPEEACAMLAELDSNLTTLLQSSSDSWNVKTRGLHLAYDVVRSIFESTYYEGRADAALNQVATRILRCITIVSHFWRLTIQQRSRLYFYLRKLPAPLKLMEDAGAREGVKSKHVVSVVNTLTSVMTRSHRFLDAKALVAWAAANEVPMRLQVIETLARAADQHDDDEVVTSALNALRSQAKKLELELPRSAYRFLANRSANSGLSSETEDALSHFYRSSTKRTAKSDAIFARRTRIALASAHADVSKTIALLAEKCDVNRVLPPDMQRDSDQSKASTKLRSRQLSADDCYLLLSALLRADRPIEAGEILKNMLDLNYSLPQNVFNAFLMFHVRRNDVTSALAIFREHFRNARDLHPVTINQMVRLFGRNHDINSANQIIRLAQKRGVPLTRSVYTSLLQAHVEAHSWDGAMALFRQLNEHVKLSMRPGFVEFSIMLHMHVLRPLPIRDTYAFLRHMLNAGFTPNAHTFTSLLLAAADSKLPDVLESIFTLAERRLGGIDGRQKGKGANGFHFTVMIQYYLKQGDFDTAQKYLQEMIKRNEPISGVLRGIIVGAYANAQGEENSSEVASQLAGSYVAESPKDFVEVYAPLIRRAALEGRADVIEMLIRESTSRGLEIPLRIWSDLLDALRREANAEGALQVWELIFNKAVAEVQALKDTPGLQDDSQSSAMVPASRKNMLCVPLSTIIDALTYAGRHDEVASIWIRCRESGFGFDSHNWNHLVVALLQAGRVGDACSIIEKVLNSQPPYGRDRALLDSEVWRKRARLRTRSTKVEDTPSFRGQAQTLFGDDAGDRTLDRESRRVRLEKLSKEEPMDAAEVPVELTQGLTDLSQASDETIHSLAEEMLEPLEARQLMETILSPWYAHFETMRMLHEIVQTAVQVNNGIISLRPPPPTQNRSEQAGADGNTQEPVKADTDHITTVDNVLREYPRVASLLRTFGSRLEHVRELERRQLQRDSLSAQGLS